MSVQILLCSHIHILEQGHAGAGHRVIGAVEKGLVPEMMQRACGRLGLLDGSGLLVADHIGGLSSI